MEETNNKISTLQNLNKEKIIHINEIDSIEQLSNSPKTISQMPSPVLLSEKEQRDEQRDEGQKEEYINAKFFIPSENKFRFIRLKIAPSTIQGAGMGVYAVDEIPKDAKGHYKGVKKSMARGNVYYSWIIYEYDTKTGNSITNKELFLLDASNKKNSNWTRYVNCGLKKRDNNMDSIQKFDKIYYFAKKKIKQGQELFIDYGSGYRKTNLGMKGRY